MPEGRADQIKQDKVGKFLKTIKSALTNPKIIIGYLSRKKYDWAEDESGAIKKKKYSSYNEYLRQQKYKLEEIKDSWLPDYDKKYHIALLERLKGQGHVSADSNVLCLAARLGTEVRSFLDMGCFAIGLDLNPGENNKYVVHGDFHNIQFPKSSTDIIFSNALDHAFDIKKLIVEIKRILRPEGLLILELSKGEHEGYTPGYYEAITWKKIDDLLKFFLDDGFSILSRVDFEYPDPGQHVTLKLGK